MKVVLRIFIPLCIFSFIAFGISVMFLGTQPITADTAISELAISDSGANTYDITDSFTSIRADIGAYKLTIKPWSENKTQVTVSGDKSSRIKAGVSGDRLTIESDWSWGENWNWSMFRNIYVFPRQRENVHSVLRKKSLTAQHKIPQRMGKSYDLTGNAGG